MMEQDTIEVMATVMKDCPPHLLKFVGYNRDGAGGLRTVQRCAKCRYEQYTPMPDEREKRRE